MARDCQVRFTGISDYLYTALVWELPIRSVAWMRTLNLLKAPQAEESITQAQYLLEVRWCSYSGAIVVFDQPALMSKAAIVVIT